MTYDLLTEMNSVEQFYVDGGRNARAEKAAADISSEAFSAEESRKMAISYTLGYLSIATCWCTPVSLAFGIAGALYTCN